MKTPEDVRKGAVLAVLAVLAAVAASGVLAQQVISPAPARNDHVWDCWLGRGTQAAGDPYVIRCIGDREARTKDPRPGSPEAALLDDLHGMIHRGQLAELDDAMASGMAKHLAGYLWQIRLPTHPSEDDWKQGAPHRTVQRLICATVPNCPVMIRR